MTHHSMSAVSALQPAVYSVMLCDLPSMSVFAQAVTLLNTAADAARTVSNTPQGQSRHMPSPPGVKTYLPAAFGIFLEFPFLGA